MSDKNLKETVKMLEAVLSTLGGTRTDILVPPENKEWAKGFGLQWDSILKTHFFEAVIPSEHPLYRYTYDQYATLVVPAGLPTQLQGVLRRIYLERMGAFQGTDIAMNSQIFLRITPKNKDELAKLQVLGLVL